MGLQLVGHQEVLDRLAHMQGIRVPKTLTQPILDGYIERATARVLRKMKLGDVPGDDTLERDAAEGACLGLVLFEIRKDFFGLDGEAMTALSKHVEHTLDELGDAAEDSGTGSVSIRVAGGRDQ